MRRLSTSKRMTRLQFLWTDALEGSKYLSAFQFMMTDCARRSMRQMVIPAFLNQPPQKYWNSVDTLRSLCYESIDKFQQGIYEDAKKESILSVCWKSGKIPKWMDREELATHLITLRRC